MQDKASFKKKYILSHKKFDGAKSALTKFPFKIPPRNSPSKYIFATLLCNTSSKYPFTKLPRSTPSQLLPRNTPSQHSLLSFSIFGR
jgi:hypothetical protein